MVTSCISSSTNWKYSSTSFQRAPCLFSLGSKAVMRAPSISFRSSVPLILKVFCKSSKSESGPLLLTRRKPNQLKCSHLFHR